MITKSVFDSADVAALVTRIERLTPETRPQWGKMSVDQMLAHVNVPYIMVYEDTLPKPGWLMVQLLKLFAKKTVVGPDPYPRNTKTAPAFIMTGTKDFANEKAQLIAWLHRVQKEGATRFDGRQSASFGPLTTAEWNVLFYKHLDHHLTQFGV